MDEALIRIDTDEYRGFGYLVKLNAYMSLVRYVEDGVEYETYVENDDFLIMEDIDNIEQE